MKTFKQYILEDKEPIVKLTIPFIIRVLEWAREEAKSDVEIHNFVENMTKKSGIISTDDYSDLIK